MTILISAGSLANRRWTYGDDLYFASWFKDILFTEEKDWTLLKMRQKPSPERTIYKGTLSQTVTQ